MRSHQTILSRRRAAASFNRWQAGNISTTYKFDPAKLLILACGVALIGLTIGCQSTHYTGDDLIPTNYELVLSDEQIKRLSEKAEYGDAAAAFKLYGHYRMVKLDRDMALKWLIKAAELGHDVAEYNLGLFFSGEIYPEKKDPEKARYWFQKSSDHGNPLATSKLKEY